MRKAKKLMALVLALTILMGMAFAVKASASATINLYDGIYSTSLDSGTFPANQSIKAALESKTSWNASFSPEFTDYFGLPANALTSLYGLATGPQSNYSGITVEAWSTVNPGYALVSTTEDGLGNIIQYNYVYVGKDWVYTVTDASNNNVDVSSLYLNQYTLNDGDTVTMSYQFIISYWSQSTPWMSTYPYI